MKFHNAVIKLKYELIICLHLKLKQFNLSKHDDTPLIRPGSSRLFLLLYIKRTNIGKLIFILFQLI
jgi:hypothetical protein